MYAIGNSSKTPLVGTNNDVNVYVLKERQLYFLFFCIYYGIHLYDSGEDKKRRKAFRETQLCASSKHGHPTIFSAG